MPRPALESLRRIAQERLDAAHVPFSGEPTAAIVLLSDGTWVPGVRVESASFSLTIPALLNAYTTAVSAGRADEVVAFVLSRPLQRSEEAYIAELPDGPWQALAADAWGRGLQDGTLPRPTAALDPFLGGLLPPPPDGASEGIEEVRAVADRAYVPASNYPVGALLELSDGRLIPGVNVEHPDWTRILCAERNAVSTAHAYREHTGRRLFLTCTTDAEGTPCGACRQVLAELTPDAALWMDRHADAPEHAHLSELLPGSFRGRALLS